MLWQTWLIISGICFVIEIVTFGFLALWFAIAALIVAFLSLFITNEIAQTTIFLIISAILILFTRPLLKRFTKNDTTVTNVKTIIGKTGIVTKKITFLESGLVKIDGDLWTAVLADNSINVVPEGSIVEVLNIDGVKLVVKPIKIKEETTIK